MENLNELSLESRKERRVSEGMPEVVSRRIPDKMFLKESQKKFLEEFRNNLRKNSEGTPEGVHERTLRRRFLE